MKRKHVCAVVSFVAATLLCWMNVLAVPGQVTYTGYLKKTNGTPVTSATPLTAYFKIYTAASGGTLLWQGSDQVAITAGVFNATLGAKGSPLGPKIFNGQPRYLEIAITGQTMTPRLPLRTVPHAFTADNCTGDITPSSVGIGTSPGKYTPLHVRAAGASGQSPVSPHVYGLFVENNLTGNDNCVFQTATKGGGKSFTITSAGNVGIGTTKPGSRLDILGHTPAINLEATAQGSPSVKYRMTYAGTRGYLGWEYSTSYVTLMNTAPKSIVLGTGGTEKVRIDGSGNVGIGTKSPSYKLEVAGSGHGVLIKAGPQSTHHVLAVNNASNTASYFLVEGDGRVLVPVGNVGIGTPSPKYRLHVNGTIGGYSTLTPSDRRWKQNVGGIPHALEMVCRLRGTRFDWRRQKTGERNFPPGRQLGVIAQEVERVVPEVVHTDSDGYKSVDYARLVPLLIEAVKEQDTVIKRQAKRYDSLRREVRELKVLVARLARSR